MVAVSEERFTKDFGRAPTADEWARAQGLLRRAERELVLLVGELGQHDVELVIDTLIDAVREDVANPGRYQSETDDSYSYRRFDMPDGQRGRFWWPLNLLDLFGIAAEPAGRLRVIKARPSTPGWVGR